MFDRFDDDNRVVDDQTDGEHQAEQRQRVDRETQQRKDGEGADQRNRDGDHRDERRPPVLQEEEDDEDHQDHGLDERLDDLADAFGDRQRRVERDLVVEVGGKRPFSSAIVFLTPSATASAFEPGVWKTATMARAGH